MENKEELNLEECALPAGDRLTGFFTPWEWALCLAFIAAGLVLRWLLLDMRPVHHDESLHIMYGYYFYDHPESLFYKYDPMLHGPFLYNILPLVYVTLGVSEWSARVPMALAGSFFLFLPLVFRRYFSRAAVLGLTAALALSPTMIYWSRFLRHDILVLAWWLLAIYGVFLAAPRWRVFWVLLAFALQMCTSENVYVTYALLLGYFIFELGFNLALRRKSPDVFSGVWRYLLKYRSEFLFSLAFCALVYAFFFTAGFRYTAEAGKTGILSYYWNAVLDGLYRKSIAYWAHQHSMERIKGPFLFQFYMLAWYEPLFVLACLTQAVLMAEMAGKKLRMALLGVAALALILLLYHAALTPEEFKSAQEAWLWKFFKLKDLRDLFGLPLLILYPVVATVFHLYRRERTLAFWGYIFTASLFTYSYLGEKVPWLAMYPCALGLIYLTLFFDSYFRNNPWPREFSVEKTLRAAGLLCLGLGVFFCLERANFPAGQEAGIGARMGQNSYFLGGGLLLLLFAWVGARMKLLGSYNLRTLLFWACALFTLRAAILTNFTYTGEASELISQVHTTYEFHRIATRIRSEIKSLAGGHRLKVVALGDATWPMTSYMAGLPEYKFSGTEEDKKGFDYILQSYDEKQKDFTPGFHPEKITLRGWWLPDFNQMTLKKFLNYSINHQPWNPTGFSYAWFLSRSEPLPGATPAPAPAAPAAEAPPRCPPSAAQ